MKFNEINEVFIGSTGVGFRFIRRNCEYLFDMIFYNIYKNEIKYQIVSERYVYKKIKDSLQLNYHVFIDHEEILKFDIEYDL